VGHKYKFKGQAAVMLCIIFFTEEENKIQITDGKIEVRVAG
jgi:hypothetical protein